MTADIGAPAVVLAVVALALGAIGPSPARAAPPVPLADIERMALAALPDGRLLGVALSRSEDGTRVMARSSGNGGHTWGEAGPLLDLPDAEAWLDLQVLVDDAGELHLFLLGSDVADATAELAEDLPHGLTAGIRGRQRNVWHAASSGGGRRWSAAELIWIGAVEALTSVAQLDSGRIVLPFAHNMGRSWRSRGGGPAAFTYIGSHDVTVLCSDDGGDTWQVAGGDLSVAQMDLYAHGAAGPQVIELPDGRVWMLIQTQRGRLYESFSPEGGEWSRPAPTNLLASDTPPELLRLPDGRLVLLWSSCLRYPWEYGNRHALHAAISDDGGRSWRGHREIARDPDRREPPPPSGDFGTGSPSACVTPDDTVLFFAGLGPDQTKLYELDPQWLLETRHEADFVERPEEWIRFGTCGVEILPHPDPRRGASVISITRPERDWPAGVTWNFPLGAEGRLSLRVLVREGLRSALLGLTDHFSKPWDLEDSYYNVFSLERGEDGRTLGTEGLTPGAWHNLELAWSVRARRCQVRIDGREVGELPLRREAAGVCYLRVRLTAEETDEAGLAIESAAVEIEPG
ncbi:MAG: sialidase family protein [Armatimonadota bacterium]